jgi:hypothetical protein
MQPRERREAELLRERTESLLSESIYGIRQLDLTEQEARSNICKFLEGLPQFNHSEQFSYSELARH